MSSVLNVDITGTSPGAVRLDAPAINLPSGHATIRSAEYSRMVRSKWNVRRKGSDLDELVALVRSQGILQNLVGFAQTAGGVPTGLIEVVAGGRRLAAVGQLIDQGELPADYQIPYLCVTEAEAIEVSLAENSGRKDMHPADVFEAMRALLHLGRSIEDISLIFHLDALTVRRRLKLANVSPRLLDLYRNDHASFEQMMALAITDDVTAQEQAWDALDKHYRSPHELRRLLTAQQVNVQTDRVARYVGLAAFEEAGGAITRDLFSDAGAGFIGDVALLDGLAMERLNMEARKLEEEKYAWVDILPRADHATIAEYATVRTVPAAPGPEQTAVLGSLRAQLTQAEDQILALADGDPRAEQMEMEADALRDRIRTITNSIGRVPLASDREIAGAVITLDGDGKAVIRRDLIRPADKEKLVKLGEGAESCPRRKGVHSDRLVRILTSHRTVALQAEIAKRPDIALAVLVHSVIMPLLPRGRSTRALAGISTSTTVIAEEANGSPAALAVESMRSELIGRLVAVDKPEQLFAWLLGQPTDALLEMLAISVAGSIDAVQDREGDNPRYSILAGAVELDMSKWWQPTADNYFNHVSRQRVLSVVTEAVPAQSAVPLEKMKKLAAAEAAERALEGTKWLPEPLRV